MIKKYILLSLFMLNLVSCENSQEMPGLYIGKTVKMQADKALQIKTVTMLSKHLNWEYAFPEKSFQAILDKGAIPQLIWEPWIWNDKSAIQSQNILEGEWDDYLLGMAQDIKAFQYPVFIQLAPMMNDSRMPWYFKNPDDFKLVFQYIKALFNQEQVNNAIWVFAPKLAASMALYYPGEKVVDWLGLYLVNEGSANISDTLSAISVVKDSFFHPVSIEVIAGFQPTEEDLSSLLLNTVSKLSFNMDIFRYLQKDTVYQQDSTSLFKTLLSEIPHKKNAETLNRLHKTHKPTALPETHTKTKEL